MDELITRVRLMIGDTASVGQVFTDQEIQDVLDQNRTDVQYLQLTAIDKVAPGGAITHLEYHAPYVGWESDAELVNGSYAVLTPSASDPMRGHWEFSSDQAEPVYTSGAFYEIYAAAADLLEMWAAKVALEFDFGANEGGQSFKRSQKQQHLRAMASSYRAKSPARTAEMTRSDCNA
jgi:hypothetical protein